MDGKNSGVATLSAIPHVVPIFRKPPYSSQSSALPKIGHYSSVLNITIIQRYQAYVN